MKFLLPVVLVICTSHAYSNEFWKRDYETIDSLARTVKPTANLEKLVNRLTSHYHTDVEKYRSLFAWIAYHIAYDVEALKKPALRETDPEKVIKRGKTVCEGYSTLFMRLCELAGLECVTIKGWAKLRQGIGKPLAATGHAWNAIKINNEWYLCDVTWGAGSVTENMDAFSFDFKAAYFCTPPELFSFNHFPRDKQWLLGSDISEKMFIDRPHFYFSAIKLNLHELLPDDGIIKYKKDKAVRFQFRIDGNIDRIYVQPSTLKNSINIPFSFNNGQITFEYVMDTYAPYLYIYTQDGALLVYKMVR